MTIKINLGKTDDGQSFEMSKLIYDNSELRLDGRQESSIKRFSFIIIFYNN